MSTLTKDTFLTGAVFTTSPVEDLNNAFQYDGMCLRVRSGEWFDYYCSIYEVTDEAVTFQTTFMNRRIRETVKFADCIIIE